MITLSHAQEHFLERCAGQAPPRGANDQVGTRLQRSGYATWRDGRWSPTSKGEAYLTVMLGARGSR